MLNPQAAFIATVQLSEAHPNNTAIQIYLHHLLYWFPLHSDYSDFFLCQLTKVLMVSKGLGWARYGVHTYSSSTWEVEAVDSLQVQGQPWIQSKDQVKQSYRVIPYLKQMNRNQEDSVGVGYCLFNKYLAIATVIKNSITIGYVGVNTIYFCLTQWFQTLCGLCWVK